MWPHPRTQAAAFLASKADPIEDALATYRDVSPFPLAWIAFQRGVMWAEMADRPDLARPLYEEAVRRVVRQVAMEEVGKKPEVTVVVSRLTTE